MLRTTVIDDRKEQLLEETDFKNFALKKLQSGMIEKKANFMNERHFTILVICTLRGRP